MADLGRGSDRLYFKYKSIPRLTKDGKYVYVRKPVIEVTFRRFSESKDENNREMKLNTLIDSGADWSFLPLEIAKVLRLDIDESEERIRTIAGEAKAYKSKVYVEIPRAGKIPVPVGFVNVHVMPNEVGQDHPSFVILGRKDFFEKFEVTINESAQFVTLKNIHTNRIKKTRF
jgi:hypothetical protein